MGTLHKPPAERAATAAASAARPASLPRRRERRGLHYWMSPRYTSRKARLEALEKVVGYLLDDRQDAMALAALAANGGAAGSVRPPGPAGQRQRNRGASRLRVIKGGAR
jgi:hypothetical protein